jgi:hypothetical protein
VGGRLLLDPGLTSGFEERLFVDHEEGVTSVTSSFTSDSPEARKDRPGCGSSVDGDEDEVAVDGRVEDVGGATKGLASFTKGMTKAETLPYSGLCCPGWCLASE